MSDKTLVVEDPVRIFPSEERFDPKGKHVYTFFMLIKTSPQWLQMSIEDRRTFFNRELAPIMRRWSAVKVRYYDAEFFTARCSDLVVLETEDLVAYQAVIEKLRETLFWDTYFQILEIIPAREDEYVRFDG